MTPRYATNGTVGGLATATALRRALHAIETAYGGGAEMPEHLLPTVRTLEAILMQRGCEDSEVGPRDSYLTSVMDVVIYG